MATQRQTEQTNPEVLKSNKSLVFHLLLGSISFLFVGLLFAYIYTIFVSRAGSYDLPWIFYLNTVVLYLTSFMLYKVKSRPFEELTKYSLYSLFLIILFFILQILAWLQLFAQLDGSGGQTGIYFLYLLSIIHSLHIIFGIPFHMRYLWQARTYSRMSNPDKEIMTLKIHLIHRYWHFLDILWSILMLVFIIHMFV